MYVICINYTKKIPICQGILANMSYISEKKSFAWQFSGNAAILYFRRPERDMEHDNKSDRLADAILALITERKLKPGDLLPPEHELATRFGGSRLSVREALRGLKFLGLVKSTPGRGTELAEVNFSQLSRYLGFQLACSRLDPNDLLDARLALELASVEKLCGRLTAKQLARLRAAAECYPRSPGAADQVVSADRELHRLLLEFGGNEILQTFSKLLDIFFRDLRAGNRPEDLERASREHHALLDAMERGNLDLARGLIKHHLEHHR